MGPQVGGMAEVGGDGVCLNAALFSRRDWGDGEGRGELEFKVCATDSYLSTSLSAALLTHQ